MFFLIFLLQKLDPCTGQIGPAQLPHGLSTATVRDLQGYPYGASTAKVV